MKKHHGSTSMRTLFGLALIAFAVLLFFKNIGLHFSGVLIGNWPIALIIIGAVLIYGDRKDGENKSSNGYLPYFLIGFGVLFLLSKHHILNFSIGALIGPLVLLFIGVNILKPNNGIKQHKDSQREGNQGNNQTGGTSSSAKETIEGEWEKDMDADTVAAEAMGSAKNSDPDQHDTSIDVFTILGGGNFSTRSQNLRGGNVVAVMGGAVIDVREADMNSDVIEIDIIAVMGGAEIKIPPHWQVSVKVLPLLGGVTNKTTCLADKLGVPVKHVVITGIAFMGGVEVRN